MTELLNDLNNAFKMVSNIPVTGDSVELMAAAKEYLRAAYRIASNIDKQKKEDEANGGQNDR